MGKSFFARHHFGAMIGWLIAVILAVVMLPNISSLVRDKGQTKIPDSAQSQVANVIQKDWGHGQGNTRQVVVVFSNGDKKLSSTQKDAIKHTVKHLRKHDDQLNIKDVLAPNDNAATKKQLISKDKTTELVQLQVSKKQEVRPMTAAITKAAKTHGVKTYLTGGDILNDDFQKATEDGIQKTEIIAAIFIFVVLVLVFRSPVVPVISLLTVGVSVITSLSVVMNLVAHWGFPLSSFTQVFLVVVLFGIGTDYNILLYDQYKEELSGGLDAVEATTKARRIAGRTILYSGTSLLIGFSALGLAKFSIYRSAVGVAVGVAVLLLVLLTLNPFFMSLLGKRMFWPTKNFDGSSNSKLWGWLSKSSVARPIVALGTIVILAIPAFMAYNNNLNYDTTAELADSMPAKQGFRVVQKHFSKGTAEPASLYIQSNHKLNDEGDLRIIDRVTKKIQDEKGVGTVASVTQPSGSEVSALYEDNQLGTVTKGMTSAGKGLTKINKGLTGASNKLGATDMNSGLAGVQTMMDGTQKLVSGSQQLTSGTQQLAQGTSVLQSGVGTLTSGLNTLNGNSGLINNGVNQLTSQSAQLPLAVAGLAAYNQQINGGVNKLVNGLNQGNSQLSALSAQAGSIQSTLAQAKTLQAELATAQGMMQQMNQLVGLLDQAAASKDQLAGLASTAGAIGNLQTAVTDTVNKTSQNDGQIAQLAGAIAQDSSNDATTRQSATKIAGLASDNINTNKALGANLQQSAAGLKGVDANTIAGLGKLANSLPNKQQVAGLKQELAATQKMMNDANSLLGKTSNLGSQMNQLSGLPAQMTALTSGVRQLQQATAQASGIATQLNGAVNGRGVNIANQSTIQNTIGNSILSSQLQQLAGGIHAYTNGVGSAAAGSQKLGAGVSVLQNGATKIAANAPVLTSGLNQELAGQQTMYTTLHGLVGQMQTLKDGLKTAGDGIGKVNDGVGSAQTYLTGLQDSDAAKDYYVPKAVLKSKTYKPAIDTYMSSDKKTTKLTIVLDSDPSSAKSMAQIDKMQGVVKNELKGTKLGNAKVAIGGQTAQTSDTQHIASSDFIRTAAIMIVGILLALMYVTRSILQPFYIIGTLLLAYIASLSITRFVSSIFLHQGQLTWNTPFFTFVMLIALGVDYSIFLMMKYREFGPDIPDPKARINSASGVIGAVVISAAIILSGTFAALMPSGVLTLIQVALGVIIGLIILVFIIPVILPALISLTYGKPEIGKHGGDRPEEKK
ncbi:MMPL family transporter [Lacticaseibacillus pabuli]|uniref:MMPL family transporter n=1 Tax=Lacticaseibacillus pabuli TaxID=3025672 RepID=A0ABY7WQP0_9LACO|nr:MMPL family transporter [Lacticaseibacillus sp. KACC 23028]WDF82499.1 MMPL family transporter [Lacticaseibacillus sp. KACC 23028]